MVYYKCTQTQSTLTQDDKSSSNHEEITGNLEVGISIRNLTKIYGQVRLLSYTHYFER